MVERADVVIAGAGIAGVSTAFHLSVSHGVDRVLLCDPRPPLTLTSDKSTECYRNWWPGPDGAMVELMNHSIDLLDRWAADSDDAFHLSRRGYLYLTADSRRLGSMADGADRIAGFGAGAVRRHRSGGGPALSDPADGADLYLDGDALRTRFPYVSPDAVGGLHVRRAGWLSAQQLGAWMLETARGRGLEVVPQTVVEVEVDADRVVAVRLSSGERLATGQFVDAAGPFLGQVAAMADQDLPLRHEVHRKISFRDRLGAVPRQAPMLIWDDPQQLSWDDDVRRELAASPDLADLLGVLPAGAHCRPDGGDDSAIVLGLWEYRTERRPPTFPIPADPLYPEMVVRGLSRMLPALEPYLERFPEPYVDGGYYTKTPENRPLIGPCGPAGFVVVGALSGFGIMAAPAAGDVAARHVVSSDLPPFASAFLPDRYRDPGYLAAFSGSDTGQL